MGEIACETHLNQTLANIAGDTRLSDVEKTFATALAKRQHQLLSTGVESRPNTWDTECNRLLPTLSNSSAAYVALEPEERLGNVWPQRAFERSLGAQLNCNAAEAGRLAQLAIDAGTQRVTRLDQLDLDEVRQNMRLRTSTLWLFRDDSSPENPYQSVPLGSVPCALGLPYRTGETFVAFTLSSGVAATAFRPCVYDPGWEFQEYWRPEGRTRPSCERHLPISGFQEWVVQPPLLGEADDLIRVSAVDDCLPHGTHAYDV